MFYEVLMEKRASKGEKKKRSALSHAGSLAGGTVGGMAGLGATASSATRDLASNNLGRAAFKITGGTALGAGLGSLAGGGGHRGLVGGVAGGALGAAAGGAIPTLLGRPDLAPIPYLAGAGLGAYYGNRLARED